MISPQHSSSRIAVFFAVILSAVTVSASTELPELHALAGTGVKVSALFTVDNAVVSSFEPDVRLNPASVTKLFTAAAAMKVIGPDHRLKTSVYRAGDDRLYIEGSGDPDLWQKDIDELAACVSTKGGRRKWSELVFSTGPFDRQDLPPAYDQKNTTAAYRAGVAGLQMDLNAIRVAVGPAAPGQVPSVKVSPMSDYIRVDNRARASADGKAGSRDRARNPLTIDTSTDGDGRLVVTLRGLVRPRKGSGYTFRVPNPAWNAAAAFVASLQKRKVQFGSVVPRRGTIPEGAERICFRPSRTMREIIVPMLKDSINPVAESVLRLVGAMHSRSPAGFGEGADRLRDFMVHDVLAPPESFAITNGSGLYGANSVSARAVVALVGWILANPEIKPHIRAAMPVGGIDGTLAGRFTGPTMKGRVFAKTGTLDEAISLAGWVEMPDGRNVAFAVLVQGDSKLNAAAVRSAIDASVTRVFQSVSAP